MAVDLELKALLMIVRIGEKRDRLAPFVEPLSVRRDENSRDLDSLALDVDHLIPPRPSGAAPRCPPLCGALRHSVCGASPRRSGGAPAPGTGPPPPA